MMQRLVRKYKECLIFFFFFFTLSGGERSRYHKNIGLKMRFKAADWKCLEERAPTEQNTLQSLRKKAKHSLTVLHLPISPHILDCITGSCSISTLFHTKINNVSSVIIKYISVFDLSPF